MRRFVTFGPALVVLLTMAVTLLAAPAAVRMVRAADAAARAQAARDALAADDILARMSNSTANVADAVLPSVVHLDVQLADNSGIGGSLGSAWVYDSRGYLVTNAHVVGGARTITAQFNDGRLYDATLVGFDVGTDVAVLKIDAMGTLVPLPRSPAPLRMGETVFSFGSPFNFKFSMSQGIVSGLGRESTMYANIGGFSNFIQFDAAVNPGNSGGPVVDTLGRAVGMNVAIANNTNTQGGNDTGQSAGISFAIPVRVVEFVASQLIEEGQVSRGFLGISLPRGDGPRYLMRRTGQAGLGVIIDGVVADGPAARAGVRADDVVVAIDGQQITGLEMMRSIISSLAPGHVAAIEVRRGDSLQTFTVEVAEFERAARIRQDVITAMGSVGMGLREPNAPEAAPVLGMVIPGTPAYAAGLEVGMQIVSINGTPVRTVQELCERLDRTETRFRMGAPVRFGVDVETGENATRRREFTVQIER